MSKLTYKNIVLRTVCDVCYYSDRYWLVLLRRRCLGRCNSGSRSRNVATGSNRRLTYLMYVLFGLAIAATVIAAVFQFGAALKR